MYAPHSGSDTPQALSGDTYQTLTSGHYSTVSLSTLQQTLLTDTLPCRILAFLQALNIVTLDIATPSQSGRWVPQYVLQEPKTSMENSTKRTVAKVSGGHSSDRDWTPKSVTVL